MNPGPVSPSKQDELRQRMHKLRVLDSDLTETFVRAGGPGGQKVNKSSSCVVLSHRPTGFQVKCQASRHQAMNRYLARRLLLDKIERHQTGAIAAEQSRIEKIRRQKRRRSRRAKNRMLEAKSKHAEKKAARRPSSWS